MAAAYDSDKGQLVVHGNVKQASVQRILEALALTNSQGNEVFIESIVLVGNVHLYIDSLKDIELADSLAIVLSHNCSLVLNVNSPTMVLPELVLIMSGASKCYVYNEVKSASIDMSGKTECIFQKPLYSFRIERIGHAAHLQICGEKIDRIMNRQWNVETNEFIVDYYDALIHDAKTKLKEERESKTPTTTTPKKKTLPHIDLKEKKPPQRSKKYQSQGPKQHRITMAHARLDEEFTDEPIKPRSPSPEVIRR